MEMTKEEFLQAVAKLADILWKGDCRDQSDDALVLLARIDKAEFCLALNNLKQVPVWARIEILDRFQQKHLESLSTEQLLSLLSEASGDYKEEILLILRNREATEG